MHDAMVGVLIKEIIKIAENKFGVGNHQNDCITVAVYISGIAWQVSLERPSKIQLSRPYVDPNLVKEINLWDNESRFYTEAITLEKALKELKRKVMRAKKW